MIGFAKLIVLVVHKAIPAMEFLQLRVCWLSLLFLVLLVGAAGERRLSLGGAGNPRDLSVILFFFKGFPALYGPTCLVWPYLYVCTYDVLYLSLT